MECRFSSPTYLQHWPRVMCIAIWNHCWYPLEAISIIGKRKWVSDSYWNEA